jgi:BMFP domain-containing protein YqiC
MEAPAGGERNANATGRHRERAPACACLSHSVIRDFDARDARYHRLHDPDGVQLVINVQSVDALAQRLAALVPADIKRVRDDLAATFRSALQAGLRDLDLVTREEFDVQRCVLLRTREKIEQLEQQVLALERSMGNPPPAR